MSRLLTSIVLSALVVLTHVGIPVYTHVCRGMERTWHSIASKSETCCSKPSRSEVLTTDRTAPSSTVLTQQPCCEDHLAVAVVDTDLSCSHSSFSLSATPAVEILLAPPSVQFWVLAGATVQFYSFLPHAPPPRLWGRSLLIFKQVFRC